MPPAEAPPEPPTDPRTTFLVSLADALRAAIVAGDHEAARVAIDAIAQLLVTSAAAGGDVVDLAARREAREGRKPA